MNEEVMFFVKIKKKIGRRSGRVGDIGLGGGGG